MVNKVILKTNYIIHYITKFNYFWFVQVCIALFSLILSDTHTAYTTPLHRLLISLNVGAGEVSINGKTVTFITYFKKVTYCKLKSNVTVT